MTSQIKRMFNRRRERAGRLETRHPALNCKPFSAGHRNRTGRVRLTLPGPGAYNGLIKLCVEWRLLPVFFNFYLSTGAYMLQQGSNLI